MEKILKAYLVILLLATSGCTWLALLDTREEPPGVEQEIQSQREQRNIEFNQKYIGMTKEEIRKEWGDPEFIHFNVRYCEKPNNDCDRRNGKNDPDIRIADEEWGYYRKFKSKTLHYSYSVSIYFVEGKVVKVGSA